MRGPIKTIIVCLGLLLAINLVFCQKSDKAEKSFAKLSIKTGSKSYSVANHFGKKWKFRGHFPENFDSNTKRPLIVALHWAGTGNTFQAFHDCLAVPGLEPLDAIIISPEGEGQLWNTENNVNKIKSIISNAKKYWNVDPDKIAVVGYSNGGNGSWFFAENHPKWFGAAIPMASAYRTRGKLEIPVYAIHGRKDELFPVGNIESWVQNSRNKGSDITLVVNESLSHFEGCNYVTELQKAAVWLKNLWTKS